MPLKDYFEDEIQIILANIDYKDISTKSDSARISVADSIDDISFDGEKLKLVVSREVWFEPKAVLDLKVTYIAIFTAKTEDCDKIRATNISDAVNEDKDYFAGIALDRVSMIIAIITSAFGSSPLVTPPSFMDKQAKH